MGARKKTANSRGFSFLELMLSMFTGTLLLAGTYYSYNVLARRFEAARGASDLQAAGHAALNFIAAELRKAGRISYDGSMASLGGAIAVPLEITESDNPLFCCDALRIEYDYEYGDRRRVLIYGDARENIESRYALYMDVYRLTAGEWAPLYTHMFVADYVVRFDAVPLETGASGVPKAVGLELVLRAKKPGMLAASFATPAYSASGHADAFTDKYARKWFRREVALRNAERY